MDSSNNLAYLDDEEGAAAEKKEIKITTTPAASDEFSGLHEKVEELDERVSTVETHVVGQANSTEPPTHTRSKSVDDDITKFM